MHGEFRTDFVRAPGALRQHPALVLNADYRPLSYYPLSLWPWQEAIKAAWLERVDIVAEYDEIVRSPSTAIRIPSGSPVARRIEHRVAGGDVNP